LELPKPIRAGEYDIRDRLGVVVRRVSLGEVHRAFYNLIVKRYLGNDQGITKWLDNQVAEPKRLLRLPGFRHEVSGQPAQLLDMNLRPIDLDPGIVNKAVLSGDVLMDAWAYVYMLDTPRVGKKAFVGDFQAGGKWGCLPGWVKSLIDYLRETGELCHYARMALASWMLWCGFSDEEIHEVLSRASDYKPNITQYHIDDVREYIEKGGKPMRCITVVEECKGYKVPNIDCKNTTKSVTIPKTE